MVPTRHNLQCTLVVPRGRNEFDHPLLPVMVALAHWAKVADLLTSSQPWPLLSISEMWLSGVTAVTGQQIKSWIFLNISTNIPTLTILFMGCWPIPKWISLNIPQLTDSSETACPLGIIGVCTLTSFGDASTSFSYVWQRHFFCWWTVTRQWYSDGQIVMFWTLWYQYRCHMVSLINIDKSQCVVHVLSRRDQAILTKHSTNPYLVGGLEHAFIFPFSWECHHPNRLSLHFSEG